LLLGRCMPYACAAGGFARAPAARPPAGRARRRRVAGARRPRPRPAGRTSGAARSCATRSPRQRRCGRACPSAWRAWETCSRCSAASLAVTASAPTSRSRTCLARPVACSRQWRCGPGVVLAPRLYACAHSRRGLADARGGERSCSHRGVPRTRPQLWRRPALAACSAGLRANQCSEGQLLCPACPLGLQRPRRLPRPPSQRRRGPEAVPAPRGAHTEPPSLEAGPLRAHTGLYTPGHCRARLAPALQRQETR